MVLVCRGLGSNLGHWLTAVFDMILINQCTCLLLVTNIVCNFHDFNHLICEEIFNSKLAAFIIYLSLNTSVHACFIMATVSAMCLVVLLITFVFYYTFMSKFNV